MFRKLYDWVFALARSKHATPALAVVSFAESSFFPIPPDVMLAPMVLARPDRAYFYAGVCTLASVLGGMLGYFIGFHLADAGEWLLRLAGHAGGQAEFQHWFDRWGLWVILIKGLTPIPYKLVTILSGALHFSLPIFIAASIVTRGLRFTAVAWIFQRFGPQIAPIMEKRMGLVLVVVAVVIVGAVLALRYLH
jgi:membrane protein YqaA with SNARE-associated domain